MRRSDREVTEFDEIVDIVRQCEVCRIAMIDGDTPYIVPLSFGFEAGDGAITLYFHGAREGRKVSVLRKNPRVCFEMDIPLGLKTAPTAQGHSFFYQSVIGWGEAVFAETPGEKRHALLQIMKHMTGSADFDIPDAMLGAVAVFGVRSHEFTAKRHLGQPG